MAGKREIERKRVRAVLLEPERLEVELMLRSGLPGPRANLELAAAFADVMVEQPEAASWRDRLRRWAALDDASAPVNHPRGYLPFVAYQALGALYAGASSADRDSILLALRDGACDSRWRLREAVVFGLQRVGGYDYTVLRDCAQRWIDDGRPLLARAALVALADPALLEPSERAVFALELADIVVARLGHAEAGAPADPAAGVLLKALAFAPSVYVAASPEDGFPVLERWADLENLAIKKAVAANLRKARLARHHPDRVAEVGERLAASWAG